MSKKILCELEVPPSKNKSADKLTVFTDNTFCFASWIKIKPKFFKIEDSKFWYRESDAYPWESDEHCDYDPLLVAMIEKEWEKILLTDPRQSAKQIIVMRKDLNMRKGKMVAQGAHASVNVVLEMETNWDAKLADGGLPKGEVYKEWINGLTTKICVSVDSEQELLDLHGKAVEAGILCSLVQDAGLTEFKEPTYTALAIGPDHPHVIDPITKHLKLL